MLQELAEAILTWVAEGIAESRTAKRISARICKIFGVGESSRRTRRVIHALVVTLGIILMLGTIFGVIAYFVWFFLRLAH